MKPLFPAEKNRYCGVCGKAASMKLYHEMELATCNKCDLPLCSQICINKHYMTVLHDNN